MRRTSSPRYSERAHCFLGQSYGPLRLPTVVPQLLGNQIRIRPGKVQKGEEYWGHFGKEAAVEELTVALWFYGSASGFSASVVSW